MNDQVRPRYVKEAFRLLRKSIIHVEAEDIILEESEDEEGLEEGDQGVGAPRGDGDEEDGPGGGGGGNGGGGDDDGGDDDDGGGDGGRGGGKVSRRSGKRRRGRTVEEGDGEDAGGDGGEDGGEDGGDDKDADGVEDEDGGSKRANKKAKKKKKKKKQKQQITFEQYQVWMHTRTREGLIRLFSANVCVCTLAAGRRSTNLPNVRRSHHVHRRCVASCLAFKGSLTQPPHVH